MALGFAAWGLISAFAPTFRTQFQLSNQATAFLIAVPVLLGSLARLPIGMLTDRFGGRVVFSGLFAFVAVAAALVPGAATYDRLLIILVLMVQMWLLTATLESYLAGHHGVALPALLSTAALFGVCVFLYRLVMRVDRMQESVSATPGEQPAGPWRLDGR